jgi:DNA-binding response OmpR family regulator
MKQHFNILLVDDEPDLRDVFQVTLELCGYNVVTAGSVDEALEILAVNKINMVISDMQMNTKSGIELLHKVRTKFSKSLPFMFLTGHSEAKPADTLALGADYFFEKPFPVDSLMAVIDREIAIAEEKWKSRPKRIDGDFQVLIKSSEGEARVLNLSTGGMFINSDKEFWIDDEVDFEIHAQGKVIPGKGVVRWIRPPGIKAQLNNSVEPGIGIEFKEMNRSYLAESFGL